MTINNINFTGGENAEAYVINNLTGGTVNFQGDIKFENNGGFEYNAIANAVGGVIKSDESSNLTFTTNQAGIVPVIDNYGELNLAGKNTFSENSSMAGAIGNSHTGTANIGKMLFLITMKVKWAVPFITKVNLPFKKVQNLALISAQWAAAQFITVNLTTTA